jgi:cyclic pyranopterin monophosphate synthase
MSNFTHFDNKGDAAMVDVGDKAVTARVATARGRIYMSAETLAMIEAGDHKKGDVLAVARLAGIMAAKKTSDLIPLCHPISLDKVSVELACNGAEGCVDIEATAKISARTGIEMEALTAVTVAGLTIYDMCKAVDKAMRIGDVHLAFKSGGKSGTYEAE